MRWTTYRRRQKKKKRQKGRRTALGGELGGPVTNTTGTEILIRLRAVMFKLSDNIIMHVFTGLLFVDNKEVVGWSKKFNTLHNVQRSSTRNRKETLS